MAKDKVVVSLFENHDRAADAVGRLEKDGFSSTNISFLGEAGKSRTWSGSTTMQSREPAAVERWLKDEGVNASDAHAYAEGVRRGGALVMLRCDGAEAERARKILEGADPADLDERMSSWKSEGWAGYQGETGSGERTIPIAEEELSVGKRDVGRGKVRIHSYVEKEPVRKDVELHQERVEVERRAVDRPAGASDKELFRERDVEVTEKREVPVVDKQARVKEELVVRKDVDKRTETVSDDVRRTKVEVEDERGRHGAGTGTKGRV
ncbi:MAG TPA: YsnF/AvaK domain-containing protein [Beijerinckiaceae bacterium]|nr:YsnF/AvaK domain-containing protein [Beijerinckiaceae bacterium]